MIKARVLFLREDGETLTFGDPDFPILSMEGIGKIAPEVFTRKKAVDHGSLITGYRIPEREFTIQAEAIDANANRESLSVLNRFFNPVYIFDVTITYLGDSRTARGCRIRKFDDGAGGNIHKPVLTSVTFLYPDAFFLSTDEFGQDIAGVRGGLVFPYRHVSNTPMAFGVLAFGGRVQIYNDGDVPTYVKAKFVFTGTCTNPSIHKGDAYVKILGTFSAGQTLVLDAYEKSAKLNGTNVSTKVEKGSRWNELTLDLGDNVISYDADFGSNNVSVYIYYSKRYLGIN